MASHRFAYYQEMQRRLRDLLASVATMLEAEHTLQLEEFIDANEIGLALECTVGYLVEADRRVSSDVLTEIDDLARTMGNSDAIRDERAQLSGG